MVELDPKTRTLRYVNAGHPEGYVLGVDGQIRAQLPASGPALSIFEDASHVIAAPFRMEDGDLLLMMTDGIHEARSPTGAFFGRDRALEVVTAHREEGAATITEHLYDAVREHTNLDRLDDDVTVVVLKAQPSGSAVPAVR